MNKEYWYIYVANWGDGLFYGTEEEAEEVRVHKARWEQSIARKRRATPEEVEQNNKPLFEISKISKTIEEALNQ